LDKNEALQLEASEKSDKDNNFKVENAKLKELNQNLNNQLLAFNVTIIIFMFLSQINNSLFQERINQDDELLKNRKRETSDREINLKIENTKLTEQIQNLHHQIDLSTVSQILKASLFTNYFYPIFYIIFRKKL
jgi:hypothetical protein